jgi:glutamate synthase domain-containing protein 2/Fe-S-cluster-containing dehydrogenase component
MSVKYHVGIKDAPPVFIPVSKLSVMEIEGCLGCVECVKREACVYDVYKKRKYDPVQIGDTAYMTCVSCMRCVQGCKKNILSRVRNPQFDAIGDEYWTADILNSIWKQSETGKIPVSGAGYRGPFAGLGFDQMWTDMSEIVRPTRDGIHGREYISTVIDLGRHPIALEFDKAGKLLTDVPPFVELPIPFVLDVPNLPFFADSAKKAVAEAAGRLHTFMVSSFEDATGPLAAFKKHLIVRFDTRVNDVAKLNGFAIVEITYSQDIGSVVQKIKSACPGTVISVRIPLDENSVKRAIELAAGCAEILHFEASRHGNRTGNADGRFVTELMKEVHFKLLAEGTRDQLAILVTGGIAMAEHVPKVIACGADGVGIDLALAAALGCRLCKDCGERRVCPVGIDGVSTTWGVKRIVNLMAAWHSQLIEVMGAMGIREVRRLRGELGRVMFFEDLERDSFSPIFGRRCISLADSVAASKKEETDSAKTAALAPELPTHKEYPPAKKLVTKCPSRFRNAFGKYKVVRTSACVACGKCVEVCAYGVHRMSGKKMLAPKSHLCVGADVCKKAGAFCVDHCKAGAIRVGADPQWKTFGDPRWTADLLVSTWKQAETGQPTSGGFESKTGASGGGFDRMAFVFPDRAPNADFRPEDVDLSVSLNKRGDDRPDVKIGIPFYGGGMSFGSVSLATIVARARAYKAFNSFTCTGEGGYPDELKKYDDHVITQVATGLFGVKEETIQRVRIVEFKYAQGAKPGLGGHLLGDKVTPAVARMRETVVGNALFSPFPFHSVYSVEDHKKHVDWIKAVNPKTLVSVKVSGASDVDMVAVGSFFAGAHIAHLDGSYGGTGAAPDIAKKNIAMPIEYAVPKVHRFLTNEGIRDQLTVVASGGLRSAWDVAKAIALGADAVVIGTAEVVALECIRCGACESGRGCPRGIATTDPELSKLYNEDWATQRLTNLFHSWAIQLQHILWRLGMKSVKELVGRSDLLIHLDYEREAEKVPRN